METVENSSHPTESKQTLTGLKSGLSPTEFAQLIEKEASNWNEKDDNHGVLLRAWCQLARAKPDQAEEGFTPKEIADAMNRLGGLSKPWPKKDGADIPKEVRLLWNRLEKLWEKKKTGLEQSLSKHGHMVNLAIGPNNQSSGGRGKTNRYWIRAEPISDEDAVKIVSYEVPEGGLSYICEDIEDAGRIARIFSKGYKMDGWRRWIFLSILISCVLIAMALVFIVIFAVQIQLPLHQLFYLLVGVAGIIWPLWAGFNPLFRVRDWKIVVAPEWIQVDCTQSDRLLEWQSPPLTAEKMIKAVRYSGPCPICKGKVIACSGGREFFHRIIGRCEEAPVEHVFSFDHITKTGRPLR